MIETRNYFSDKFYKLHKIKYENIIDSNYSSRYGGETGNAYVVRYIYKRRLFILKKGYFRYKIYENTLLDEIVYFWQVPRRHEECEMWFVNDGVDIAKIYKDMAAAERAGVARRIKKG